MNDKYIWALDRLLDESAKKLLAPIINEAAAKAVKKAGKPMTTEEWEEYKPEYGSDYAQAIHVFNKLNLLSTKPVPGKMYYVFTPTVADTITIPPKQPMIAQYLGSRSGNYVFKTPNEREVALPGVTNTPDDNGVTGTIIISNTERYDLMRQYLKNKFGVDIPPVSKPSGSTVAAEDASTKMFLEADEESDEPKVVRRKTQQQDGSTSTHWVVLDYSGEMAGGQGRGFSDLSAARAFLKANRKKLSAPPDDINEELIDEDLRKWFKEKWVRFNPQGKIMGPCARGDDSEGKPKCLPQSKAHALGKKGRASAAARKRREDPNPERSGKAINVNTKKKKADESVEEGSYKRMSCPECGGPAYGDQMIAEEKDACYHKVKSRYKVWPSAYACVPEETSKALTRDGWKTVDELSIGEEIMTYSMEKDVMEFKPILNLHRYSNTPTTIVKSGNTGFMFECTPNHKWVVKMPDQKSDRASKYEKVNGMALLETSEMLEVKSNKHLVVTAPYEGGNPLKKDKMFKYGDNWTKYILDITPEQRQSWLFSAIVYDGNQIRTERVTENKGDVDDLDWVYSGNHGKQSFGFKQKDVEHRDAFLLAAFLNGGTVTWKEHNKRDIYSCYYVSNKRYKNLWNFKSVQDNVTDVWCPETENNTWVMMQETDGKGIITITGNSGALSKCRKVGAKNWGNKSKK